MSDNKPRLRLDAKGTDVAMEELHLAPQVQEAGTTSWYLPELDSDQSEMAREALVSPFMMENGDFMRRGIVSPRDLASGQATGVTADSVWDDTDIVHVLREQGFTGSDEELGALIAWMRANNLIDTSTGELRNQGDASELVARLRQRGIFDTSTGEIAWADGPRDTVSMLNNKNPDLTYRASYIGEADKDLDLDGDGPTTLLGSLGNEAHAASGDVDGADFLVWRHGVSGDGVDADDPALEVDDPGDIDLDI
jgi:hypothetical protein